MSTVAYIRKSVVHAGARTLSWEIQESEVRALAARYGDEPEILSDWGRSGRLGRSGRPGYDQLVGLVEAGKVTAVYAYSLSRLSRSLVEYARFAELCSQAGIPVRFAKEGEVDFSSASGRLIVNILAAVAQMEAELAQERSRDAIKIRRERGDNLGRAPYDNPEVVIEAYREAGSYHGAARVLANQGVPTSQNGKWRATTVRNVVKRYAPHLVPVRSTRGRRSKGSAMLSGLLRCSCGSVLSPNAPKGYQRYYCQTATDDPAHPMPKSVSERALMEWIQEEAAHLRVPDVPSVPPPAEQADLWNKRGRVLDNYEDGLIDREARDRKLEALDRQIESLRGTATLVEVGPVRWDASPEVVNDVLRAMWRHVQLDEEMRPVVAEWVDESWRLPGTSGPVHPPVSAR